MTTKETETAEIAAQSETDAELAPTAVAAEPTKPDRPAEPGESGEPAESGEPVKPPVLARRSSLRNLSTVLVVHLLHLLHRLRPSRPARIATLLAIVLTASAAVWSQLAADAVHAAPTTRNTALADVAATAEVKSQITQAVDTLFSFDFSDPAATDAAASADLTGAAVNQYATLMSPVRSRGAQLKLMLTTTVTSAGVQTLRGDRARVLIFADQTDTSTATAGTSESSVALAVDVVRIDGKWRIAGIDTLGA